MATRGTIGFRTTKDKNTIDNIYSIYNHYDSYYSNLGVAMLTIFSNNTNEDFKQMFESKTWDSNSENYDYEELFSNKKEVFSNHNEFMNDGLMCEYAYLYNLETDEVEVYRGFENEMSYEGQEGYLGNHSKEMFYINYKFSVTRDTLIPMKEMFKSNSAVSKYIDSIAKDKYNG